MHNKLDILLRELKLKSLASDISKKHHAIILNFLEKEKENQRLATIQRLLVKSGISKNQIKTFEQFDWNFNPKIPKQDLLYFKGMSWIAKAENLVLIGDTGLGKTHLSRAICYEAILKEISAYCITAYDLISKLSNARSPSHRINYYAKKVRVLCIDELGYMAHKKEDSDLLFQIISKRSEILPTIISTNLSPKNWGSIFSGPAASAILDRLSYKGTFLSLEGRSYRLKFKKN